MSIIKEFTKLRCAGKHDKLQGWVSSIGAAFGKIVSSLVANIIMPPLGLLIGGIDFKQFAVTLRTRCAGGYPCCCDALRCLHSKRL